jgi:hypothetical protein
MDIQFTRLQCGCFNRVAIRRINGTNVYQWASCKENCQSAWLVGDSDSTSVPSIKLLYYMAL